jgi:hypothetical protein
MPKGWQRERGTGSARRNRKQRHIQLELNVKAIFDISPVYLLMMMIEASPKLL